MVANLLTNSVREVLAKKSLECGSQNCPRSNRDEPRTGRPLMLIQESIIAFITDKYLIIILVKRDSKTAINLAHGIMTKSAYYIAGLIDRQIFLISKVSLTFIINTFKLIDWH